MTIDEQLAYYANLLIIQYNGRPRASATIQALAEQVAANAIYDEILNGFNIVNTVGEQDALLNQLIPLGMHGVHNLESKREAILDMYDIPLAVGKQLDMIGDYIGCGRGYFYKNNQHVLEDSDYLVLLRLKAMQNVANHSVGNLADICYDFYRSELIPLESGIMGMVYLLNPEIFSENVLQAAIYYNAIPRPLCVQLQGYIDETGPFFSLFKYNELGHYDFLYTDTHELLLLAPETALIVDYQIGVTIDQLKMRLGFCTYATFTEPGVTFTYKDIKQF